MFQKLYLMVSAVSGQREGSEIEYFLPLKLKRSENWRLVNNKNFKRKMWKKCNFSINLSFSNHYEKHTLYACEIPGRFSKRNQLKAFSEKYRWIRHCFVSKQSSFVFVSINEWIIWFFILICVIMQKPFCVDVSNWVQFRDRGKENSRK